MKQRSQRTRRNLALTAGLATALCCFSLTSIQPAFAASTDELQTKVDEATQAYNTATAKVNDLQAKIDESQSKISDVEQKLPEQKQKASSAIRSMYKMQQDSPSIVTLLLSSSDFTDFVSTYQYISSIQRDNTSQTQQLSDLQQELVSAQETLVSSKNEATNQQQAAQNSMQDAQAALDELNRQLAEQAAQAAAQKAAEEAAAAQAAAASQVADDAAQQQAQAAVQQQSQPAAPQQAASKPAATTSNPNANDGSEVATDGTWMIGMASGYDVDPKSDNVTKSKEILTPNSVTVAVPQSQEYLIGRSVQIRFGGKIVTARVTDTGDFAKYGRSLDLAGGVWKAFGFSSAGDWGVRAVQYRFL